MASTQLQQRLRLDRPFEVQMQLDLWQLAQPIDHIDVILLFTLLPCHLVSVIAALALAACGYTFSGAYLDLRSFHEQKALGLSLNERSKFAAVPRTKIDVN